MSKENKICTKRSHQKNRFAFPDDLEIPESALKDHKFLSCYVRIFNDPRVHKRHRLNGDRTSSRFDVDNNFHVKVIFNEPIIKRKSILSNTQSPKEKNPNDSDSRKSVSFLSKITYINSNELDGVSSDWTDNEVDGSEAKPKTKSKSKIPKTEKSGNISKKEKEKKPANGVPSSKIKKKAKDKSSNKLNGKKAKPSSKELFKFKITKSFRKFGRSKEKKLKHLQKKFGRRMFKAFVHVERSFNLKIIPDKVAVPSEKITLSTSDVTTPEKNVPSIQDFLIGQMTKKLKVSLNPVQNVTEIMQTNLIESNSLDTVQNSSTTKTSIKSENNAIDESKPKDNTVSIQSITPTVPSTEKTCCTDETDQADQRVPASTTDVVIKIRTIIFTQNFFNILPRQTIESCNDTEPSREVVESNTLPNIIDKITCSMYYNTNKDETITMNGQMLESNNDDQHMDLVDNISTFNVSFSMPATKSLAENILNSDSSEIASIQFKLND